MKLSKYTTELRYICEVESGLDSSVGYNDIDTVIQKAIPKIFSFDFPIFDKDYRNVLCTKILMHYYTREIGEETYGLWKLRLQTKLNEIMPYYNQMYESQLLKFNPLYDIDTTTEHTGSGTGNEDETIAINRDGTSNKNNSETTTDVANTTSVVSDTATSGSNDSELDLYSDTPQGGIENVENADYLSNIRKKSGTNSASSSSNGNTEVDYTDNLKKDGSLSEAYTNEESHTKENTQRSTEEYITKVAGKSGGVSYSKMLQDFRKTFLNIDMEIIENLANIFMNVW